jgi:hypothetical protein
MVIILYRGTKNRKNNRSLLVTRMRFCELWLGFPGCQDTQQTDCGMHLQLTTSHRNVDTYK